jgi:hypothetical protein
MKTSSNISTLDIHRKITRLFQVVPLDMSTTTMATTAATLTAPPPKRVDQERNKMK